MAPQRRQGKERQVDPQFSLSQHVKEGAKEALTMIQDVRPAKWEPGMTGEETWEVSCHACVVCGVGRGSMPCGANSIIWRGGRRHDLFAVHATYFPKKQKRKLLFQSLDGGSFACLASMYCALGTAPSVPGIIFSSNIQFSQIHLAGLIAP